jgi:hypothetical protein
MQGGLAEKPCEGVDATLCSMRGAKVGALAKVGEKGQAGEEIEDECRTLWG